MSNHCDKPGCQKGVIIPEEPITRDTPVSPVYVREHATSVGDQPFIFKEETWERKEIAGQIAFNGPPGSWYLPPIDILKSLRIHALVRCPACLGISALHKRVTQINRVGKLSPDFVCTHTVRGIRCTFQRVAYLDNWNKKPLYAAALEHPTVAGGWRTEIVYCHASTVEEARKYVSPPGSRVVSVGRAIGFFQDDQTGRIIA